MEYFDFKDGIVSLRKDCYLLYPIIKNIIQRDKGGKIKGDPDGRKHEFAMRELTYVYFRCNFYMYPIQHGLSEKEAHKYSVTHALLPDDYLPDDSVKELMKQYSKEHLTPAKHSIRTLLNIFAYNDTIIENIMRNINVYMKADSLAQTQISELLTYQKQLMEIATNVPKQANSLREAMNAIEEEEKKIKIARGGAEVKNSQDPNNDIESGTDN